MRELHKPTIAILASGGGTTAEAFIRATQDGRVNAEVGLVICSKPPEKAGIFEKVKKLNTFYGLDIEAVEISGNTHPDNSTGRGQTFAESSAICEKIADGRFGHVALMGYMRIVRGALLEEYGWKSIMPSIYLARMSNTHPGPLPATQDTHGLGASERVIQLGMSYTAHTFQLVAAGVDRGPVLAEHPILVNPGETAQELFDRVQDVEKAALPYALDKFLRDQEAYYASA
jgi:phosphoribosylglycinamide formyltransferase-1